MKGNLKYAYLKRVWESPRIYLRLNGSVGISHKSPYLGHQISENINVRVVAIS